MKKYRKTTAPNAESAHFKMRLSKTRGRAKFVGYLYLLFIVAFAAVACLPFYTTEFLNIGVTKFYKTFTLDNLKEWKDPFTLMLLASSAIYALMLLGLVVNVLRAFGCLGWLHKKTASKEYGFDRPVFAMNDLGKLFSGSFAVLICSYFLISVLSGLFEPNRLFVIVLGAGVLCRLFLGVWGAKASYFTIQDGKITENKRDWGRVAPFVRNLLQLAAVFGILYYFVKAFYLYGLPSLLLDSELREVLFDTTELLLAYGLQIVALLFVLPLIKHATAITEYNENGREGSGMKTFRVFALLTALAAGGVFAVHYFKFKVFDMEGYKFAKSQEMYMLFVAGIAFVAFIVELIMHKLPRCFSEAPATKNAQTEEEFGFEPQSTEESDEATSATQPKSANGQPTYVYVPVLVPPLHYATGKFAPAPYPCPMHPVAPPTLAPTPAPATLSPAPAPVVAAAAPTTVPTVAPVSVEREVEENDPTEGMQKVENGKAEVRCPFCDTLLRVDGTVEYHRCPTCSKVFQLRTVQK